MDNYPFSPSEAKANTGFAGSSAYAESTTSRRGCIEVRPYYKIRESANMGNPQTLMSCILTITDIYAEGYTHSVPKITSFNRM